MKLEKQLEVQFAFSQTCQKMAHFSQHAQFGVGVQGIHCFCLPTPGYWATEKNTVHTLISFSSLFYSGEIRNTFWKHWLPARKGGKQKKKKKDPLPLTTGNI